MCYKCILLHNALHGSIFNISLCTNILEEIKNFTIKYIIHNLDKVFFLISGINITFWKQVTSKPFIGSCNCVYK